MYKRRNENSQVKKEEYENEIECSAASHESSVVDSSSYRRASKVEMSERRTVQISRNTYRNNTSRYGS